MVVDMTESSLFEMSFRSELLCIIPSIVLFLHMVIEFRTSIRITQHMQKDYILGKTVSVSKQRISTDPLDSFVSPLFVHRTPFTDT